MNEKIEELVKKYGAGWHPDCVRDFRSALREISAYSFTEAARLMRESNRAAVVGQIVNARVLERKAKAIIEGSK